MISGHRFEFHCITDEIEKKPTKHVRIYIIPPASMVQRTILSMDLSCRYMIHWIIDQKRNSAFQLYMNLPMSVRQFNFLSVA